MQTPLERAARALCAALGDDWNREGQGALADAYKGHVRAVLEAIREPSQKMVDAGYAMASDRADETDWEWVWQAMLDTALKDE